MRMALVVVLVAASGCKKGPDVEKAKKQVDLAAVQKLVPADKKVEFELVVTPGKRSLAVYPKGWQKGFLDGEVKPPEGAGFGFFTRYRVDTSCDGECTSKDWAKVLQEGHLAQLRKGGSPPEVDEAVGPEGWIIVSKGGNTLGGTVLQWHKGGSKYQTCNYELDDEDVSLEPAFRAACKAMVGLRWDRSDP